jgi:PAS domain S-box-containing protein
LRIRDHLRLGYEWQIRISLIFLTLLLILLNLGTEYLFHRTKQVLRVQTRQQLSTVALSASLIWERSPGQALRGNLRELSLKSGVSRISFLSSDGEPLISSGEILSADELHVFVGLKPDLIDRLQAKGRKQKLQEFFSDLYTDGSGNTYLSCYLPLDTRESENPIWVMVEGEVSALAKIEKVSRLNARARVLGFLVAVFVTLLLIKRLLRPYRLMVKKATKEKLIPPTGKRTKDGELDIAVGVFEQVIKELKQKEKALQQLYQKTDRKARDLASYNEYILKSMTSGMIITDEAGKITRMNHPAETILDKSEDAVLGKHYEAALGENSPICSIIQSTFEEQRASSIPEVNLAKKGGESIPLSLSSSAVRDERGGTLGVVAFLTDLTEIKKLEEQIAFKDKMATLGEMSSGLAHELRNSMGAILGFGKLLKKKRGDPASQSQVVDGILNEAMSTESMLKRFLAFAKPFQPKTEKVDLKTTIRECHTSVEGALKESKIAFTLDSQANLPLIQGDRLLLKQCFQNLIQNSIEAMPDGGELGIRLEEKQKTSEEKVMMVEISDTGCGMAKGDQDRIFNPFFTSREKGTGLGLSLVKKIVSLHNGEIGFESELNKGTTFRIYLPFNLKPELPETDSEGKLESEPAMESRSNA